MKSIKILLSVTLCLAILLTTGFAFYNTSLQNRSGRYSSVTTITSEERVWILERFGQKYASIEEYISFANEYARTNFHYDYNKKNFFQYFDFKDIIDGDMVNAICFDFSVLFKHITIVLNEEGFLPTKDSNSLKIFVVDVKYQDPELPHHSYNVIVLPSGRKYYIDLTATATRAEKGLKQKEDYEIFNCSIEDYCKKYKETVVNYH